jgi:hypothetical protein
LAEAKLTAVFVELFIFILLQMTKLGPFSIVRLSGEDYVWQRQA